MRNATEEGAIPPRRRELIPGEEATLVYSGCLAGKWFDWELLLHLAERHPEWSISLIGKETTWEGKPVGETRPNLCFLGEVPYPELRGLLAQADVGLIPFRGKVARGVDPIKYYDYLAAGLPAVATTVLAELQDRPHVFQAKPRRFARAGRGAGGRGILPAGRRRAALEGNTWDDRAEALIRLWKENP